MLAQTANLDVLDNDHFVVALMEKRTINNILHVLLVARGEEEKCLGVALRRGEQTLAIGVLADALQQRTHGSAHALDTGLLLLLRLLTTLPRSATWWDRCD